MFNLISSGIFTKGVQPLLQVLKLNLHLRLGGIHLGNCRRGYLHSTHKVLEAFDIVFALVYVCGCNIYYCGLGPYVQVVFQFSPQYRLTEMSCGMGCDFEEYGSR